MTSVLSVRYRFAALLVIAFGVGAVLVGRPLGAQPQEEDSRSLMAALRAGALTVSGPARSSTVGAMSEIVFGNSGDEFIPADYDGDGKNDHAVWTAGSPGTFKIRRSIDGVVVTTAIGLFGDDPTVVGDYDGDGKADIAFWRAGASPGLYSTWFYQPSSGGGVVTVTCSAVMDCGKQGDFPAPGDYNNDGKYDFVVQRPHTGVPCSVDNTQGAAPFTPTADFLTTLNGGGTSTFACFGRSTDSVAPGDYDGDGKTDITVARSVSGTWTWLTRRSSSLTNVLQVLGNSATDFITQGDYDGDALTDLAVWRVSAVVGSSAFFIKPSTGGPIVQFPVGLQGDYPVANWNVH